MSKPQLPAKKILELLLSELSLRVPKESIARIAPHVYPENSREANWNADYGTEGARIPALGQAVLGAWLDTVRTVRHRVDLAA